jgi:signal transduction protein with GAF and PtsI domain
MSSTSEDKLHGTIMVECRGKSRAMIMKNVTNIPNVVRVSKTEDDANGGILVTVHGSKDDIKKVKNQIWELDNNKNIKIDSINYSYS